MKKCYICKEEKSKDLFDKNRTRKDNLSNYCKECNKKRQRKYYHENKERMSEFRKDSKKRLRKRRLEKYLKYLKSFKIKCLDCGINDFRIIEWHHRNPLEKEENISRLIYSSWVKFLIEVEKCDPLCRNCHAIRHWVERHGECQ